MKYRIYKLNFLMSEIHAPRTRTEALDFLRRAALRKTQLNKINGVQS